VTVVVWLVQVLMWMLVQVLVQVLGLAQVREG
jgi:hypothetical protein